MSVSIGSICQLKGWVGAKPVCAPVRLGSGTPLWTKAIVFLRVLSTCGLLGDLDVVVEVRHHEAKKGEKYCYSLIKVATTYL